MEAHGSSWKLMEARLQPVARREDESGEAGERPSLNGAAERREARHLAPAPRARERAHHGARTGGSVEIVGRSGLRRRDAAGLARGRTS